MERSAAALEAGALEAGAVLCIGGGSSLATGILGIASADGGGGHV
ncbi:hypothetical protein [Candidatus Laterigemmans baculatus]|nr:hypothetical protein [Candidatus Laterigemmans baculatus]